MKGLPKIDPLRTSMNLGSVVTSGFVLMLTAQASQAWGVVVFITALPYGGAGGGTFAEWQVGAGGRSAARSLNSA